MYRILQLDIAGNPTAWITHRDAITMTACDRVLANLGENELTFRGGYNRFTGLRSEITVGSILLTRERVNRKRHTGNFHPPLTNKALFTRDGHTCLYCGESFSPGHLTRDHILPVSRGGPDRWSNCVTACAGCNHKKGNRTPEEWGHLLLAVPFVPNWAEFLYLKNKKQIIADQQAFLQSRFSEDSPLI
jgi:5-methylcytosine-specific restriction endonuclease McrA